MKTKAAAAGFWGVCLWLWIAAAAVAQPVGQILVLHGEATAVDPDGAVRALQLNASVFPRDRILTAEESRLQILFVDDSLLSVGEKSDLVIDEYVYSPASKTGNAASHSLASGLFRVVTDKITRLNPEGFRVRTRMATIGIRGCDLGFRIEAEEETIFVVALHSNQQVVVERTAVAPQGHAGRSVTISTPGMMVLLRPDREMEVRRIPPDAFAEFWSDLNLRGAQAPQGGARPDFGAGSGGLIQPDPPPPDPPPLPEPVPPPEEDDPEPAPHSTFIPRGSGIDWSWGLWEMDGQLHSVEFSGNRLVSPTDFQAIANGSILYNLSGEGVAAAVVAHGGENILIEGSSQLYVQVGLSVAPNWNGSFQMSNNQDDSLYFTAAGAIQTGGQLTGNQTSYGLFVRGDSFSGATLTDESISGRLVGPGSGSAPFTGAVGNFTFTHGNDASVQGGFGADFSPP